jgi:hypothetical protein
VLRERAIGYPLKSLEVQAEKSRAPCELAFWPSGLERRCRPFAITRRSACFGRSRRGGQRIYDHEDAHRLAFIRRCRDFDFSSRDPRAVVADAERHSMRGKRKLAEGHLGELRKKLGELQTLERPSLR